MEVQFCFEKVDLMLAVSDLLDHAHNIKFIILFISALLNDFMVLVVGFVPKTGSTKRLYPETKTCTKSPPD
jgi:hypothetical protein